MGGGLSSSSTTSSTLFTDQTTGLNTNQVDNASGMEISNPATGEPQHLPSLAAPAGQGLQLQFGSTNPVQPFIFNQQNINQQTQSIFEGNTSSIFGACKHDILCYSIHSKSTNKESKKEGLTASLTCVV